MQIFFQIDPFTAAQQQLIYDMVAPGYSANITLFPLNQLQFGYMLNLNAEMKEVVFSSDLLQSLSESFEYFLYLNPPNADPALKQLFNGAGEEERDGEPHGRVQRHRHKHTAGGDGVPQQHVDGERDEHDDFAGAEKRRHVETSQVGALHDLGDLLPRMTKRNSRMV